MANAQTLAPLAPSSNATDNATNTERPTIQITSPQDDQQVPPGELSINGISSDDEDNDCKVFADVNDNTPMSEMLQQQEIAEKRMTFPNGLLHILKIIS